MRPSLMATPKWKHHAKDLKYTIIKGSQNLIDIQTCKMYNCMADKSIFEVYNIPSKRRGKKGEDK